MLFGTLTGFFLSCKDDDNSITPTTSLTNYFTCDTAEIVYNNPPEADTTGRIPVILSVSGPDYYKSGDSINLNLVVDTTITNINIGIIRYLYNKDKGKLELTSLEGYYKLTIPDSLKELRNYSIPIIIASNQKGNFLISLTPETGNLTGKYSILPMSTSASVMAKMEIKLEWLQPVDLDLILTEPIDGSSISRSNPFNNYGIRMIRVDNENCIITSDTSLFYEEILFDSISVVTYDPAKKYKIYVDAYSRCHIDTSETIEYKVVVNFKGEESLVINGHFEPGINTTVPELVAEFSPADFGTSKKIQLAPLKITDHPIRRIKK